MDSLLMAMYCFLTHSGCALPLLPSPPSEYKVPGTIGVLQKGQMHPVSTLLALRIGYEFHLAAKSLGDR